MAWSLFTIATSTFAGLPEESCIPAVQAAVLVSPTDARSFSPVSAFSRWIQSPDAINVVLVKFAAVEVMMCAPHEGSSDLGMVEAQSVPDLVNSRGQKFQPPGVSRFVGPVFIIIKCYLTSLIRTRGLTIGPFTAKHASCSSNLTSTKSPKLYIYVRFSLLYLPKFYV